ncbi:MAG: NUDIX hydrolase [Parcubacteria group bacterium GW2011_GWC1_41_7]|nr:MAG: NUDIX hydrolase [Parcubacteria group bacterium GW2011_GWC1_41_7]
MAKKYIALATAEGLLPKDNMHINKLFVATKAFIEYEGKILILQESGKYVDGTNVGRYDVPGGRVEPGQRFDESLRREIKEETGLEVEVGGPFYVGEFVGIFFMCKAKSSVVVLGEDHGAYEWIDPKNFETYNLIENLKPAFRAYLDKM